MAFSMGRPMCIRERDYDTTVPSVEDGEELEAWTPGVKANRRPSFAPKAAYTISTFNSMSSLCELNLFFYFQT